MRAEQPGAFIPKRGVSCRLLQLPHEYSQRRPTPKQGGPGRQGCQRLALSHRQAERLAGDAGPRPPFPCGLSGLFRRASCCALALSVVVVLSCPAGDDARPSFYRRRQEKADCGRHELESRGCMTPTQMHAQLRTLMLSPRGTTSICVRRLAAAASSQRVSSCVRVVLLVTAFPFPFPLGLSLQGGLRSRRSDFEMGVLRQDQLQLQPAPTTSDYYYVYRLGFARRYTVKATHHMCGQADIPGA